MPEFAYIARDAAGKKLEGKVSAPSRQDAIGMLAQRSLFPVDVQADRPPQRTLFGKRIKAQVMATVYGQLSDLLKSGVPLLRSLEVLQRQIKNRPLSEALEKVRNDVEQGTTLADSMSKQPLAFSEMAVNMIRAGGEGGFLEEALQRVSDFTQKQQDLKSRTMGALAYPLVLASVASILVTILIVFFVPQFAELFESLRQAGELPVLTDWLLAFSTLLRSWGFVILGLLIAGVYLIKVKLATPDGRRWKDALLLKLPMVGMILRDMAVARFCRVLGTLLHNGVPILKSLQVSSEATGNVVLSTAIQDAAQNISSGESLATPLGASRRFPPNVVEMISVAEESNTLEKVLVDVSDGLERTTWRQLELFVKLLEPLMLVVMAGIILMIVIALLLPVIKMSSAI